MPRRVTRLVVRRLGALSRRFVIRLLAPTLAATVAVMAIVVLVVTSSSAAALSTATSSNMEDLARAATARLDAWEDLVQAELSGYAAALEASPTSLSTAGAELQRVFFANSSAFTQIDLVDTAGQVVASSGGSGAGVSLAGSGWLVTAAQQALIAPIQKGGGRSSSGMQPSPPPPGTSASRASWSVSSTPPSNSGRCSSASPTTPRRQSSSKRWSPTTSSSSAPR